MATTMLELEYVIREYHEYMRYWTPTIGEALRTEIEEANPHDRYAIGVAVACPEGGGRVHPTPSKKRGGNGRTPGDA